MALTILHAPSSTTKQVHININLFTDSDFITLRKLVDALYHKLHSEGIGCLVNQTKTLMDKGEEKLWQSGVLDPKTPQGLLNYLFFLNWKNFCLREGAEHRDLKISQQQQEVVQLREKSVVRYTYVSLSIYGRCVGMKCLLQHCCSCLKAIYGGVRGLT